MKDLESYIVYNSWANKKLFDFISANLDDSQIDREITSSFPSVRKTVYHIWDAETIWLKRLKGEVLASWPSKDFKGTFEEARILILKNEEDILNHFYSYTRSEEGKMLSYKTIDGQPYSHRVSDIFLHCMNHSTFHRGQLVTLFRQLGFTLLPQTDYVAFLRSRSD